MPLKRKARRSISRSPMYMVLTWFNTVILSGTILLCLPYAHKIPGMRLDFLTALFTAVSAACVTGLSVINIGESLSFFGQLVLFILMELGGLGIMTFASFGFRLFGRRLSLQQHVAVTDAIYQNDAATEFKKTFMRIFKITIMVQVVGALAMLATVLPRYWGSPGEAGFAVWSAMFHAVSAFCNSGFTLYPDGLDSLRINIPFLLVLLAMVTLGGLGYLVLNELSQLPGYIRHHIKKPHWISLHTKVVLSMTAVLIIVGIMAFWILGTEEEGSSLWHAVFEAVSARTAGFSIVNQAQLPLPSIIILLFLMFVGGSPGSCAGGIKTTSLAIWLAHVKANLRNDQNVNLFGYTIAPELVSRARILMALTVLWNLAGVFILAILHPEENLQTLAFEQISAFGTVGLTMDFTPRLEPLARIWIVFSMFVGRLGPLSIALWVVPSSKGDIGRPIGRIMVG